MDQTTVRALGALYIALTNAMPSAAAELAHDTLRDFMANPYSGEERALYQMILTAVSDGETEKPRSRFRVIEGGNSAA